MARRRLSAVLCQAKRVTPMDAILSRAALIGAKNLQGERREVLRECANRFRPSSIAELAANSGHAARNRHPAGFELFPGRKRHTCDGRHIAAAGMALSTSPWRSRRPRTCHDKPFQSRRPCGPGTDSSLPRTAALQPPIFRDASGTDICAASSATIPVSPRSIQRGVRRNATSMKRSASAKWPTPSARRPRPIHLPPHG